MSIIEKIRAEVERLKETAKLMKVPTYKSGWNSAMNAVLQILSDLEKSEKPTIQEQPVKKMLTAEDCPYRSSRVLHDERGEFHLCYEQGWDCECIPNGCPYLIMKNSKIKLPDIPGYVVRENAHEKERNEMLSKIDEEKIKALEVQPVCEGLEEEIERYLSTEWELDEDLNKDEPIYIYDCTWEDLKILARHFAKWGAEHRGSSETSKDLEEAADEWVRPIMRCPSKVHEFLYTYLLDAVRFGAKWQEEQDLKCISEIHRNGYNLCKEQMMKEAVEGRIAERRQGKLYARCQVPKTMKVEFGDKVRIIIVKEDEK